MKKKHNVSHSLFFYFFFYFRSKSRLWISTCKRNIQRKSVMNTRVFEKSKSFVIKGWLSAVLISFNIRFHVYLSRITVSRKIPVTGNRPPTLWKSWPRKCVELVETNWHARTPIKTFSLLSYIYTYIRAAIYTWIYIHIHTYIPARDKQILFIRAVVNRASPW